jgi:hypothetical protein
MLIWIASTSHKHGLMLCFTKIYSILLKADTHTYECIQIWKKETHNDFSICKLLRIRRWVPMPSKETKTHCFIYNNPFLAWGKISNIYVDILFDISVVYSYEVCYFHWQTKIEISNNLIWTNSFIPEKDIQR